MERQDLLQLHSSAEGLRESGEGTPSSHSSSLTRSKALNQVSAPRRTRIRHFGFSGHRLHHRPTSQNHQTIESGSLVQCTTCISACGRLSPDEVGMYPSLSGVSQVNVLVGLGANTPGWAGPAEAGRPVVEPEPSGCTVCGAHRVARTCSWVSGGESPGDLEPSVRARGVHSTLMHVQRSSSRRPLLPGYSIQESGLQAPALGGALSSAFFVCLCELDCVSRCVCLQKGVGLSLLSLPWKAPKSRVGDSPAPPTLTWSSLGQSSKRKVFGGEGGGGGSGGSDNEGLSRFYWIPLQCFLGIHLYSGPSFLPHTGLQTIAPELRWGRGEGRGGLAGGRGTLWGRMRRVE